MAIAWGPLLGVLLTVNLIVGVFASRITSVVKVQVEGVKPNDRSRIRAILQRIHSQPALQLNRHVTESLILEKSAVSRVEMTRNIFGRARVKVEYRRPVAAIANMAGAALGRDGVIFQESEEMNGLPVVSLPSDVLLPSTSLVGTWRSGEVAGLAAELADLSKRNRVEISSLKSGGLCLNIGSKFAVQLGLPEKLDEKVEFLRKLIEDDPALLVSGQTLNLVSLERPTFVNGTEKSN